jgi:hypothetical protein
LRSLLLLLLLSLACLAQTELGSYLAASDPLAGQVTRLCQELPASLAPYRKSRDLLGLRAEIGKAQAMLDGLASSLASLTPPAEATAYQAALVQEVEAERARTGLLRQVVEEALAASAEARAMRAGGASDPEVGERLARFTGSRERVASQLEALRAQAATAHALAASERARLDRP